MSAKSENGYKLLSSENNKAEYQVKYDTLRTQEEVTLDVTTGMNAQVVGELDKVNGKRKGTATLTKKAAVKGSYADTVIFTVTPSADSAVN